jgi:hypothetical protein
MKTALIATLLPAVSLAQSISGTFSASFQGFGAYGEPQVQMDLALQCSLTCPPSAPTLHYAVAGGVDAYFVSAPSESAGSVSTGFASAVDPGGASSTLSTSFKPGSVFKLRAKSCTCWCGNRVGEGGYVDLESPQVVIPAWIGTPILSPPGRESSIILTATPRGSETVEVQMTGAGLNETRTLTQADFGTNGSVFVRFTPTMAGTVTVTATLRPSGVAQTRTYDITGSSSSSGTGGASGVGGGAGGGDGSSDGEGCGGTGQGCNAGVSGPALFLAFVTWLGRRRRATPPESARFTR